MQHKPTHGCRRTWDTAQIPSMDAAGPGHGTDQPHGHSRTWNMAQTNPMDTVGHGTWHRPTPCTQ